MKPENKEDLQDLTMIKHHLESLSKMLDKRHSKGKMSEGVYKTFKAMNDESLKEVEAELAAL